MYQSQYLFDSSVNQLQVDSSAKEGLSNVTFLSSQWRSAFLVFHKDSSYGYRYDPRGRDDNLRVGIDAATQIIKGTNRFDSFLAIKPDSTIWNVDKTELKEVYFFPEKKGMPAGRLGLSYSKKLNHLKESFNSIVDSVKKMKLFKIETIFNEFYSEKDKKIWPSMENITEMREYTVENFEEIMTYFNRYKSSIGKND